VLGHVTRGELAQFEHDRSELKYPDWRVACSLLIISRTVKYRYLSCSCQGGLYVLGHVTRGELAQCEHDPIVREYPDRLGINNFLSCA
jgi:hypothetical protein